MTILNITNEKNINIVIESDKFNRVGFSGDTFIVEFTCVDKSILQNVDSLPSTDDVVKVTIVHEGEILVDNQATNFKNSLVYKNQELYEILEFTESR